MVEKIIVQPEEVRGLGNVVSPTSVSDFDTYLTSLGTDTETIDGVDVQVYCIAFNGTTLVLTVSSSIVASGDTVTCTAVLLDENSDPIEDADVSFYMEAIE